MRKHVAKVVVASEPGGNIDLVRQLTEEAVNGGADAIALLGSLAPKAKSPNIYGDLLKALAEPRLPAFYIPGPEDVPFSAFLRQAANFELVLSFVRGVHGTFALAPGYVVFAGLGGTILDNPESPRDETHGLRYPGWEAEYRLKFLQDMKDYEKIFMFATPPEHKGQHQTGSSVVAELVKTHNPRLVLIAGREQKQILLGNSLIVCPGMLTDGQFVFANVRSQEVVPGVLERARQTA
jgi:hypothetical protein